MKKFLSNKKGRIALAIMAVVLVSTMILSNTFAWFVSYAEVGSTGTLTAATLKLDAKLDNFKVGELTKTGNVWGVGYSFSNPLSINGLVDQTNNEYIIEPSEGFSFDVEVSLENNRNAIIEISAPGLLSSWANAAQNFQSFYTSVLSDTRNASHVIWAKGLLDTFGTQANALQSLGTGTQMQQFGKILQFMANIPALPKVSYKGTIDGSSTIKLTDDIVLQLDLSNSITGTSNISPSDIDIAIDFPNSKIYVFVPATSIGSTVTPVSFKSTVVIGIAGQNYDQGYLQAASIGLTGPIAATAVQATSNACLDVFGATVVPSTWFDHN